MKNDMNVFLTQDKLYYRKWVHVIFNLFLNGSAHYLSRKKDAGIIWFISMLAFQIALLFMVWCPLIKIDLSPSYIDLCILPLWFVMLIDSFRYPIRRISRKQWFKFILLSIGIAAIEAVIVLAFNSYAISPFKMPTTSMSPTIIGSNEAERRHLESHDWLLVNRFIYRIQEPRRGDIVVFRTKGMEKVKGDRLFIKRIVALPRETITIHPPYVYINGKRLDEPRIFQTISDSENGYKGYTLMGCNDNSRGNLAYGGITLHKDEYFVLGDNSAHSLDSRMFGPIRRENVVGKVFCIFYPVSRKGWID
ncbi:MAG: signal peptidase I [Victivallales bacterium]